MVTLHSAEDALPVYYSIQKQFCMGCIKTRCSILKQPNSEYWQYKAYIEQKVIVPLREGLLELYVMNSIYNNNSVTTQDCTLGFRFQKCICQHDTLLTRS